MIEATSGFRFCYMLNELGPPRLITSVRLNLHNAYEIIRHLRNGADSEIWGARRKALRADLVPDNVHLPHRAHCWPMGRGSGVPRRLAQNCLWLSDRHAHGWRRVDADTDASAVFGWH